MPKREDIKKIMLIGAGPIVIGQACEFDTSGVQACKTLKVGLENTELRSLISCLRSPVVFRFMCADSL
ncbi:MAG: hypothetical protein HY343_00075 [Lentisphaerae bacterium]|nr:hypothetical protein [Lentisphaerota bacterium]